MRRASWRGEGKWERTTWDEALETIAQKMRAAIVEDSRDEVMYHVGRPGHDGYMERVLGAWGVDAHNSHTNVCSSSGRFGYHIWWLATGISTDRWASAKVDLGRDEDGIWRMRHLEGVRSYERKDPDSSRIFWRESGIHQNLTFPVHPDPVSGMHCWHQKVTVTPAHSGDIQVDPVRAYVVYKEWIAMTRSQTNRLDNLRRPLWMIRPYRPANSVFKREPSRTT